MSDISELLEQLATPARHGDDVVHRHHVEESPYPADPWCAYASWVHNRVGESSGIQLSNKVVAYGKTPEQAKEALLEKLRERVSQRDRDALLQVRAKLAISG